MYNFHGTVSRYPFINLLNFFEPTNKTLLCRRYSVFIFQFHAELPFNTITIRINGSNATALHILEFQNSLT